MKAKKTNLIVAVFVLSIILSFMFDFNPGREISYNFWDFVKNMGSLLPPVFILIGLFEVWVKKETVEKYLGDYSGVKSYFIAILLSAVTIGGLIVALPIAISIYNKGAKSSIVYTFIFASAICRIPMTLFEATFLGVKFTIIRLLISLPLIILASIIMGRCCILKRIKN